jgi:DUF1009 family protein
MNTSATNVDNAAHLSAFLPTDFCPAPIALIAGKGRYPELSAERIRACGLPLRLIAFEDETDTSLWDSFAAADRACIKVGQLGKLLKSLRKLDCRYALMAGQITPRRLFRGLHLDLKALAILQSLNERNAETIFGAIASEISAIGIGMLDARCFVDDHLATIGPMTTGKRLPEQRFIDHGIRIAKHIAEADIGQGVVVRKGTVLAVEAFEGTDPMLQRAGGFKTDDKIFVKTVKRKQDYRFDVPVLGLRTLEQMSAAHIQTAVVAAGSTLILDKDAVLKIARKLKIELLGFAP